MSLTPEVVLGEHLGLSIPTDEAINVLDDDTLKGIDNVLINAKTLIRNYLSSIDSTTPLKNISESAYRQITNDIDIIKTHVEGNFNRKVYIYNNDYRNLPLKKGFKYSIFKEQRTDKQKARKLIENEIIHLLFQNKKIDIEYDSLVTGDATKSSMILSHLLIDLLSNHTFKDLVLLESHTGAIKGYALWGKKLNVRKEWKDYFPLNGLTLNILGDGELFGGSVRSDRQRLFELAQQYRWNGATTRERVKYTLTQHKDDFSRFKEYLD